MKLSSEDTKNFGWDRDLGRKPVLGITRLLSSGRMKHGTSFADTAVSLYCLVS